MCDHLERLVFIDETSLKTNMTKAAGWAPEGARLIDHAPGGHWNTQTFIAGLRHDKIDATGIISGPMDKEMFDLYVEGILAPTLRPGDVVILDNLPAHRSTVASYILKDWRAPIGWSGLIVSASWASGPSGLWFPARVVDSPMRCAA